MAFPLRRKGKAEPATDSSYSTSGTDYESSSSDHSSDEDTTLHAHLDLLRSQTKTDSWSEVATAPIFTQPVRMYGRNSTTTPGRHLFTQYGLLGGNIGDASEFPSTTPTSAESDPRIFQNVAAPSSVFICGSQGSGKSHTLSCMLENCLVRSKASVLPRPLTGIVFHYDTFISNTGGSPCEAAYLSSNAGVSVRVLCPPTNIGQIKNIYSKLPNVVVEELRINQADLNTKRMLDLMAVSSIQGGSMPLYLHVVSRILRDLRIQQQLDDASFDYAAFKRQLENETLTDGQMAPLQQRLETLESFMVNKQALAYDLFKSKGNAGVKPRDTGADGTSWSPKSRQLTIVDLSCPCVTADMACSLFNICLSLFLEQDSAIGRVIALDEAHKYMTYSAECSTLTESLLSTIRLQRHLAARVIISTQEPTISPRLLDLCSVTIVHRFTSPDWLESLKKHLAGASSRVLETTKDARASKSGKEAPKRYGVHALSLDQTDPVHDIFSNIIALRPGEALMFAPSAIIGVKRSSTDSKTSTDSETDSDESRADEEHRGTSAEPVRLGHGVLKVRIRQRVTTDGGRSILAV